MEPSNNSWITESEQCDILDFVDDRIWLDRGGFMDSIEEDLAEILGENIPNMTLAPALINSPPRFDGGQQLRTLGPPPQKVLRPVVGVSTAHPIIINFGDTNLAENVNSSRALNPEEVAAVSEALRNEASSQTIREGKKRSSGARPPSQTYNHIVSERKRRKMLSQRFLILSRMVPDLNKIDKTSILGEAIKYLKNLQERVDILEEKQCVESAVLVRKSHMFMTTEELDENMSGSSSSKSQPLMPEVEAKVCNNEVLLKIHCHKQSGILMKILSHLQKLNLTVVHMNVSPFGNSALHITITLEMDKESTLMANEIVQALHSAFQNAAQLLILLSDKAYNFDH